MSDFVRWAVPENQPQSARLGSRLVAIPFSTEAPVVQADPISAFIRVGSTASATVEVPETPAVQYLPLQRKAKEPERGLTKRSQITQEFTTQFALVTAQAQGRVRVSSTANATVEAPVVAAVTLVRAKPANQPEPARLRSRRVVVPGGAIVTAEASGRVRVRSVVVPVVFPPAFTQLQGATRAVTPVNEPEAARLQSRVPVATFAEAGVVSAQAVGRVRVRAAAAASVVVQAAAQGRVRVRASAVSVVIPPVFRALRSTANQPQAARLRSRIPTATFPEPGVVQAGGTIGRVRVRASAVASVIEVAQVTGRVRVRSTLTGSTISPLTQAIRGRVPNDLVPARLRTRIQDVRPPAGVTTAQAAGRVRVRASATGSVIQIAVARGRVRVRASAVGTRIVPALAVGRVRVRSRLVGLRIATAFAQGRVRVRARTVGTNIARGVVVGRVRVRTRLVGTNIARGSATGRIRVRSATTADFFGQNFVFGSSRGRLKVWSRISGFTFDGNPRWPQTNDPDQWPAGVGVRWPQTNDPDNW